MKIIVGLGNPGKEYEETRHNLGFMAIDKIAKKLGVEINKNKFNGLIGELNYDNEKVLLVKPQTFMNLSGNCVEQILDFYKLEAEDLIVIYDDIDIEFGKIRIRPSGSPGTHNGMRNITNMIQSQDFCRIRIGTGKPRENQELFNFVLSKFNREELKIVDEVTSKVAEAIIEILTCDVTKAMNSFN